MRKNNVKCVVCWKEMYRRPFEIKKARYFACIEHRETAKKMFPITNKQKEALKLWRTKWDNHLTWIPKKQSQKDKMSKIMKKFCKDNPDIVKARWKKISWENHYLWKWWITKLQIAVRTCWKNRNWIREVKKRDSYKCRMCESKDNLEVHHIVPVRELIQKYNIKNHRDTFEIDDFWDLDNWITLCSKCHILIDNKRLWN